VTQPKPKQRRCAIYTRKSSEEGLEQDFNSLHAQRDSCEAFIKSQKSDGWVLVPTAYDDGGISGGTMERPALQRLLADFAKMVEVFDAHGVSFVAVTQQFNTTSSMGRLTLNILLSFAQFEREVTRDAEGVGLSKSGAARNFDELMERGFLKLHKNATFSLRTKEARTWEITAEQHQDKPATKDFMRWNSGAEKNKTRSHQRDAWSHQRDSNIPDATKLPGLVPLVGPKAHVAAPDWSHQRDTYNIPCAVQTDGATQQPANIPANISPSPSINPDQQQQQQPSTIKAGRQLSDSQQQDQPADLAHDPRQIDLEDLLGAPAATAPPSDQLRLALKDKLQHAPRGERVRLAKLVNLSRSEFSHFLSGRRNLNSGATAVLRLYVNGECAA